MKILIIGVGGIGGFIGSFLVSGGFDVTFVSREKRFSFLKSNGLIIESELQKIKTQRINVIEEIPNDQSFDIIINTVKLYDFDNVTSEIKKRVRGNFLLLPFQNGIYAEEKIKESFIETQRLTGAVAQISAYVDDNQHVKHVGKLATFFVGHYNASENNYLKNFCNLCQKIGLDLRFSKNIKEKIWDKFIFLSAYSGITTLTEKTIGEIFDDESLRLKFISAMNETYELSRKYSVVFKIDPVESWIEKIKKMPYEMTSSMYVDFKKRKELELDWLSGSITKLCKYYQVDCPTHYEIIKGIKSKLIF